MTLNMKLNILIKYLYNTSHEIVQFYTILHDIEHEIEQSYTIPVQYLTRDCTVSTIPHEIVHGIEQSYAKPVQYLT